MNQQGASAQPALATSTIDKSPDETPTAATAVPTTTVLATIPAVLPIVPSGIPFEHGPTPSPVTFGELSAVYLTACARSSRGIYPTVLEVLLDVVSMPEGRTWFVVTVGHYTGIYQEL